MNDKTEPSENQTLLGFDFGMRHIGVAVGQSITCTASPLETLKAKQGIPNWSEITDLIQQWKPDAMVVGIPYYMDGTEYELTQICRKFATRLKNRYSLPVYEVDERLSTVEAKQRLFDEGGYRHMKQSQVDSYAACLILETWLKKQQ